MPKPRLMPHDGPTRAVARKELRQFFGSPIGYLFLLTFLGFVLFVFYWGEAFFTRNIADVRPLFEWLPIFLIFLSSALTMRMWSEERRVGTMEFVLTLPTKPWQFVVGKFLACWALLVIALLLTVPLPIVVSIISNLDWGPVMAGYIAATLLGATYIAIGLYVSARTDNQIVSLIISVLVCGAFYIIGQPLITDLFNYASADVLRALGTGSRFESITRGLLDIRDLYYYFSICAIFLVLNVTTLRSVSHADGWAARGAHTKVYAATTLAVLNLILVNFWLSHFSVLRVDLTEGNRYTISPATEAYLGQLREPLLIRGYFSAKTHPLLAPLGPEIIDLLREYEVASNGKARLEIIDPAKEPELEDEANEKYGIRPVPFKISDRYQASVVNSYFDVLLAYGDQYEVLGFRDLIEIKAQTEDKIDVRLRNPEFDITRAIKKVIQNFQSSGSVFDNLPSSVQFRGYISEKELLSDELAVAKAALTEVLNALVAASDGRFTFQLVAPEADGGAVAKQIREEYGFAAMAESLLSTKRFHFYMVLTDGETLVQVPLPEARSEEGLRLALQEGLKRFATGLLQKVTMRVPEAQQATDAQGRPLPSPPVASYQALARLLANDFKVDTLTTLTRQNPAIDTKVLILMNPKELSEYELFLVDQFLMRGGTLVLASSAFDVSVSQKLSAFPKQTGLEEWLDYHGLKIDQQFVLDTHNARYPIPVQRKVGVFIFNDIKMLDYPYFIDLREAGLNQEVPPLSTLQQLTLAWASPIEVDAELNLDRKVTELLTSSELAWRSPEVAIMPTTDGNNSHGFAQPGDTRGAQTLGVMIEGRFESFFEDPPLPPKAPTDTNGESAEVDTEEGTNELINLVNFSSPKARLIVLGSGDFVSDQVLSTAGSAAGTAYTNSLHMMINMVEWSVEDLALLSIRNRSHFNRTLPPMERTQQQRWEYLSYLLAGIGLLIVFLVNIQQGWVRQNRQSAWLHVTLDNG